MGGRDIRITNILEETSIRTRRRLGVGTDRILWVRRILPRIIRRVEREDRTAHDFTLFTELDGPIATDTL